VKNNARKKGEFMAETDRRQTERRAIDEEAAGERRTIIDNEAWLGEQMLDQKGQLEAERDQMGMMWEAITEMKHGFAQMALTCTHVAEQLDRLLSREAPIG
jgi:hypothetical protein